MRARATTLAALSALVSSGCARQFRPDAFRRGTTVAVVTVHSAPRVRYVSEYSAPGPGGTIANGALPEGKTPTLDALRPLLVARAERGTRELLDRLRERLAAAR